MTRAPKHPEQYCITAFDCMRASLYRWGKPETSVRSLTRIFYVNVHDSGKDAIGLISEEAMKYKIKSSKKKTTDDHYTRPQAQAYMIYDEPDKYLSDYDEFRKIFFDARKTITLTKEQNDICSEDTSNDGTNFVIQTRSDKLYQKHGIKLFSYVGEGHWKNRIFTPASYDDMMFNDDALLNEERFIPEPTNSVIDLFA